MARPDGKSVYVTLPAERKTPFFAFAEGGVFDAFRLIKRFRFYDISILFFFQRNEYRILFLFTIKQYPILFLFG